MEKRIYVDNAATTKVAPEVLEAMLPCFNETFGNPSSIYAEGRAAKSAIEKAREQVADLLEGYVIMDALSDYDFWKLGIVDLPIPCNDHIKPFIEKALLNSRRVVLNDLGAFTIGIQGKCYPKEVMQAEDFSPSAQIKGHRILFRPEVGLKKAIAKGFKLQRISSDAMA